MLCNFLWGVPHYLAKNCNCPVVCIIKLFNLLTTHLIYVFQQKPWLRVQNVSKYSSNVKIYIGIWNITAIPIQVLNVFFVTSRIAKKKALEDIYIKYIDRKEHNFYKRVVNSTIFELCNIFYFFLSNVLFTLSWVY